MPNRIKAIGLEVEGGWKVGAEGLPPIKHDGSVQGIRGNGYSVGEISSQPLTNLTDAEAWLKTCYPDIVNSSCGFHVHVSVANLHYSRLMDASFNNCFLNAMEDFWSRFRSQPSFDFFRERLDGQNRFCQKVHGPEDQLWRMEHYGDHGSHPRYRQLNFCWGRHGTLECRLFPCFEKVEHAVEAVKVFTKCIEDFLANCPPEKSTDLVITKEELEAVTA